MKNLIDYQIPFGALPEGIHDFDFKVDDTFFGHFEYAEIKKSNVKVDLELDRQIALMVLDFHIQGEVVVECGRCLDDLQMPIDITEQVIVKFGDEVSDSRYIGEEAQIVSHKDNQINVAQYIYEFIVLGMPVKKVHPENEEGDLTCNPEMLDKLEGYSVQDEEEKENTDPRWDKLRDLLKN